MTTYMYLVVFFLVFMLSSLYALLQHCIELSQGSNLPPYDTESSTTIIAILLSSIVRAIH